MNLRMSVRDAALAVVLGGVCANNGFAAKPTDAFKRGVESVWRKVPYSRMTGKSGKVQTWGVVVTDGLVTGSPLTLNESGMTYDELCYRVERADGSFRVPDPDKQDAKKAHEPAPPGTVLNLEDVSFRDDAVVFHLFDQGHDVTRTVGKKASAQTRWERYCVLLQFSMTPSGADRLDAADVPKMLSTIEGVLRPFSTKDTATEFAKTVTKR